MLIVSISDDVIAFLSCFGADNLFVIIYYTKGRDWLDSHREREAWVPNETLELSQKTTNGNF
ncbi:MAG: hypothetical protein CMM47_10765 [Rhodospirillaceae bacterium]|nr:hypothetical protein [Rhodospirillaceae bacterium]